MTTLALEAPSDAALWPFSRQFSGCNQFEPCEAHLEDGSAPVSRQGFVDEQRLAEQPLAVLYLAACPCCGVEARWTSTLSPPTILVECPTDPEELAA
jgi:hypothetical protein